MARILIIDDEKMIRLTLKEILRYENYITEEAIDGEDALKKLQSSQYDLALCDIKMPKMDGIEVLEMARKEGISTAFIMISAHGNIETAVEATKKGAFDFIQKPPDLNRLLITIRNALENNQLTNESVVLKSKITTLNYEIIGEDISIVEVKNMIEKVAPTEAKVLITGPNGSGKELVARQIHLQSRRNKMPFVEVNCAAIPSELIESELFGHEKGSFTSAIKSRVGKFEQAHGGTLFLDEIGDMSLAAQAKVLRAIQEKKIMRVGGEKEIEVDVRIVAATNKLLKSEIQKENFREDLYHRLAVVEILVPSLNQRKSDISILAQYLLKKVIQEYNSKPKFISADAIEYLSQLNWTGNIRELRNVIERLYIMCDKEITLYDVQKYANK